MSVRHVHEPEPLRQTLLEIYVAVVAEAKYNDFSLTSTSRIVWGGFLAEVSDWDDYPHNAGDSPDADEDDVREVCKTVLRSRKGSGYAQRLVELCSDDDLPSIIVEALEHRGGPHRLDS